MAKSNTRLELTWIGKENRPKLEPRILIEDPAKSYHATHRTGENDIFDNRLIFGDNLLVLKALEQKVTGKIKCIYIDPPYNTGSAFTHYDDGVEHSIWLSLMRDRLEILRRLLTRAIALCGSRTGLAEEQAQPVIIVEGGAEFATADAVARGAVVAQHVQGHPADQSQVFRRVIVARPTGIFAKLHVQNPMLLIFDAPVTAHGGREPIAIRERA